MSDTIPFPIADYDLVFVLELKRTPDGPKQYRYVIPFSTLKDQDIKSAEQIQQYRYCYQQDNDHFVCYGTTPEITTTTYLEMGLTFDTWEHHY